MSKEKFRIKYAVYLIPRKGNQVLLSLRQGTGYMDGHYSLVAGHVDGGETAEEALIRESSEEAGITMTPEQLKFVYVMHRLKDAPEDEYIDMFFECTEWDGEITNLEPQKCGGLDWVDINNLPENTLPYIAEVLNTYEQGKRFSSVRGGE